MRGWMSLDSNFISNDDDSNDSTKYVRQKTSTHHLTVSNKCDKNNAEKVKKKTKRVYEWMSEWAGEWVEKEQKNGWEKDEWWIDGWVNESNFKLSPRNDKQKLIPLH